jgi:thiol-disulfide isomerase/thioredoxin
LSRNSLGWIVFVAAASVMLVAAPYVARRVGFVHDVARPDLLTGRPAPGFKLLSLDGKTIQLSDFKGKPVLLNFWATWCQPCKVEMPWFDEFQKKYAGDGLEVIGIATQDDSSRAAIAKFANEIGAHYTILVGNDSVSTAYGGIPLLPSTIYVNRDGIVVSKAYGLRSRTEIEDDIKLALGHTGVPHK